MRSDQPQSGGRFSSGVIIPIQGDIQAKDLNYKAFILARGMLLCKLPLPPPKVSHGTQTSSCAWALFYKEGLNMPTA